MNILILGGNGVIGNGINDILSRKYNIYIANSKIYNRKKNQYKLNTTKKFDVFIHAGGVTDEEIQTHGPKSSMKRSSEALKKLIDYLILNDCKKFVYISSQRVYQNFDKPNKFIFNENRSKTKPTSIYEKCHLISEKIFKRIPKKKNYKTLILRPGIVFRIPEKHTKVSRPNLIQYAFLNSLIKNNIITINSSGKQFRNFSINQDIGKIILNWLLNKNCKNFVISNTKGKIISVIDYAKLCCLEHQKLTKNKSKIIILGKDKSNFKKFEIHQQIKFRSNVTMNLNNFIRSYLKISINKNRNMI